MSAKRTYEKNMRKPKRNVCVCMYTYTCVYLYVCECVRLCVYTNINFQFLVLCEELIQSDR